MSRPAMRHPTGRWSLSQVHTHAGVTLAIARRVAGLGWVNAEDLTVDDIVVLQVAAALLDAPRPSGPRHLRENHLDRDELALNLTRDCIRRRANDPHLTLLITPGGAMVAENLIGLMNALNETSATPRLLLPLGAWIAGMPALNTDRVAS